MHKVFAQSVTLPGDNGSTIVQGPAGLAWATNIGAILTRALTYIFAFAGLGLLLMILASGFTLLTSAGDMKKLEAGKQRLTQAIIGFLLIFSAFWIVQIVGKILGIQDINNSFL